MSSTPPPEHDLHEKHEDKEAVKNGYVAEGEDEEVGIVNRADPLARELQSRHMQMIAIGMLPQPVAAAIPLHT